MCESEKNYPRSSTFDDTPPFHHLQNHWFFLGGKHISRFHSKTLPLQLAFTSLLTPLGPHSCPQVAFKKTLYFLYENDNRPFAAVKYPHSLTVDRHTSLLHTIPHCLYIHGRAENACKTNEKQRNSKNAQNERCDHNIKRQDRYEDSLHQ